MWRLEDPVDLGLGASYGRFFPLFPLLDPLGLPVEVEVYWVFRSPIRIESGGVRVLPSFVVRLEVAVPYPGGG